VEERTICGKIKPVTIEVWEGGGFLKKAFGMKNYKKEKT